MITTTRRAPTFRYTLTVIGQSGREMFTQSFTGPDAEAEVTRCSLDYFGACLAARAATIRKVATTGRVITSWGWDRNLAATVDAGGGW